MFKKLLATAVLVCSIPALASAAWNLKAQALLPGGTYTVDGGKYSVTNGLKSFTNYSAAAGEGILITPNPGYSVTSVMMGPDALSLVDAGVPAAGGLLPLTGIYSDQLLTVSFGRTTTGILDITATALTSGGNATPSRISNVFDGSVLSTSITFRCIPERGYKVSAISGATGYILTPALANAEVSQSVNVTIPAATQLTGPVAIGCSFATTEAVANAGAPQTKLAGVTTTTFTLTGSAVNGDFSKWKVVKAPADAVVTIAAETAASTSVTVDKTGTYQFEYRVADSGSRAAAVTSVKVVADLVDATNQCVTCHEANGIGAGIGTKWAASAHNNSFHPALCANCHVNADAGAHPGLNPKDACVTCHAGPYGFPANLDPANFFEPGVASCASCHGGVSGDIHAATAPTETSCIACHDVAIKHPGNVVSDNNGVRSVTQEFTKWSHHVTGVNLQDAHCAACHLEGKAEGAAIVIDTTYHMADAQTHLRNADTDADMAWDPAAPNHSTMDNFCMSCHDANGATSPASAAIRALMVAAPGKTASATNPFADTISNRYDKMQRPAVVNVDDQFDVTNNSHHGVKGARYTGRTRAAGARQIASPATFTANSTATLYGTRSTIYDSVNAMTKVSELATNPAFNALYVPLENAGGETAPRTGAAGLGDDSTLHCGDCHTVGQFKANATKNAAGTTVATVIGAHGSNNEYMLRNDKGTDERHTQDAYVTSAGVTTYQNPNAANLVCFNCHSYKRYGSVYNATGATGPHAGEYDSSGRCNGVGNTIPFNGYTTGTATDGTQFESRWGEHNVTIAAGGSYTTSSGKVYTNTGTAASTVNVALGEFAGTPAFAPGFPLNFANAPGGVQALTYTGEQAADFGNVFGIQCLNCHNSGVGNGYGGIHGSANNSPGTANTVAAGGYATPDPSVTGGAYVDGMGNTGKVQRFLPGLGNVMHVPGTLAGAAPGSPAGTPFQTFYSGTYYTITTGIISNDANWEQIGWKQITGNPTGGATGLGAGCYTLNAEGEGGSLDQAASPSYGIKGQSFDGGATTPDAAKTWGGCDDHTGKSVGGGDHGFYKRINRPVTY